MKTYVTFWILMLFSWTIYGQLKSTKYGLDMMLRDIPKEQLINDIRFEGGVEDTIGVVRLDHVGPSLFPLLISSKLPILTDSLGILAIKLHKDTLDNFLWVIDHINPKVYTRRVDEVLIRVTYRFKGILSQYYVTNAKITTGFFQIIEKELKHNGDIEALDKFYEFISSTGLHIPVKGKWTWTAYNSSPFAARKQSDEQHQAFIFETNLPDEVHDFYEKKIKNDYELRTDVNPFYLKGDFDGDKQLDYAINIVEKKTLKKGILIYHSGTNKYFILGAGKPFKEKHPGDNFSWMDAWKITEGENKKKDSILVIKTESSSGVIYWTGKEYKWRQEGD
jgi:hypothetical protein